LKTLGIPGELLKIAPVAAVGFVAAVTTAACLRFTSISFVLVIIGLLTRGEGDSCFATD
jgi:hypothetical protein